MAAYGEVFMATVNGRSPASQWQNGCCDGGINSAQRRSGSGEEIVDAKPMIAPRHAEPLLLRLVSPQITMDLIWNAQDLRPQSQPTLVTSSLCVRSAAV